MIVPTIVWAIIIVSLVLTPGIYTRTFDRACLVFISLLLLVLERLNDS